jgi:hypothetical protein
MNHEKKEALKSGIIGAAFGFTVSFLVNYFLVPFPESLRVIVKSGVCRHD